MCVFRADAALHFCLPCSSGGSTAASQHRCRARSHRTLSFTRNPANFGRERRRCDVLQRAPRHRRYSCGTGAECGLPRQGVGQWGVPIYEFTPIPGRHVRFDLSEPANCLLSPLLHSSDVRHGLTDERKPQFQALRFEHPERLAAEPQGATFTLQARRLKRKPPEGASCTATDTPTQLTTSAFRSLLSVLHAHPLNRVSTDALKILL
jgi:hypothetical protein